MRQSQLRAFHNVAVHGGFSRAAEAMHVSQPAVSDQVRKLETEHDVLLFTRDRKKVRLTKDGEGLFLLTKQLFELEDQITDYMSATRAVVEGVLRVIVDSAHHIPVALPEFRRLHPKIHVTLHTGNSEDVLNTIRSYDAEIGIVGSLTPGSDMGQIDLGSSAIVGFAARHLMPKDRREFSLHDLAAMPLVFREKSSKTRQKVEAEARRQGLKLSPIIEAQGREAVRELVASGAGFGFVSAAEFGHDSRIAKFDLAGCDLRMNETLVFLNQRRDVRVIRAFVDFVSNNPRPPTHAI